VIYVLVEETCWKRKRELGERVFLRLLLPSRSEHEYNRMVPYYTLDLFQRIWGNIYKGDNSLENLRLILKNGGGTCELSHNSTKPDCCHLICLFGTAFWRVMFTHKTKNFDVKGAD